MTATGRMAMILDVLSGRIHRASIPGGLSIGATWPYLGDQETAAMVEVGNHRHEATAWKRYFSTWARGFTKTG